VPVSAYRARNGSEVGRVAGQLTHCSEVCTEGLVAYADGVVNLHHGVVQALYVVSERGSETEPMRVIVVWTTIREHAACTQRENYRF
jgi:hypothetical protein